MSVPPINTSQQIYQQVVAVGKRTGAITGSIAGALTGIVVGVAAGAILRFGGQLALLGAGIGLLYTSIKFSPKAIPFGVIFGAAVGYAIRLRTGIN